MVNNLTSGGGLTSFEAPTALSILSQNEAFPKTGTVDVVD